MNFKLTKKFEIKDYKLLEKNIVSDLFVAPLEIMWNETVHFAEYAEWSCALLQNTWNNLYI